MTDEDERAWVAFACAALSDSRDGEVSGDVACENAALWADGMLARLRVRRKPAKPAESPFR